MNIDIAKKYTTRSGLPVLIYATYPKQSWGVHGAVVHEDGRSVPCEWHHDGSMSMATHELDLFPAKTWRAWKEGEAPVRIMLRQKGFTLVETKRTKDCGLPALFLHYVRVYEDGTETPCGVEE